MEERKGRRNSEKVGRRPHGFRLTVEQYRSLEEAWRHSGEDTLSRFVTKRVGIADAMEIEGDRQ